MPRRRRSCRSLARRNDEELDKQTRTLTNYKLQLGGCVWGAWVYDNDVQASTSPSQRPHNHEGDGYTLVVFCQFSFSLLLFPSSFLDLFDQTTTPNTGVRDEVEGPFPERIEHFRERGEECFIQRRAETMQGRADEYNKRRLTRATRRRIVVIISVGISVRKTRSRCPRGGSASVSARRLGPC